MRRCYARISTAVNPLRRETPKSPWSRWIGFSAPSGHFRIVFRLFFLILCVPMVPWLPSFFVVGFSIGGFMSFVRP